MQKRLEAPFKVVARGMSDKEKVEKMLAQVRGEIEEDYEGKMDEVDGPTLRRTGPWSDELRKLGIEREELRVMLDKNTAQTPPLTATVAPPPLPPPVNPVVYQQRTPRSQYVNYFEEEEQDIPEEPMEWRGEERREESWREEGRREETGRRAEGSGVPREGRREERREDSGMERREEGREEGRREETGRRAEGSGVSRGGRRFVSHVRYVNPDRVPLAQQLIPRKQ